ncbi:MAG: porin [Rickettsiaceae bacterium]|nr:porin [Rickettsiaceae bacterium]
MKYRTILTSCIIVASLGASASDINVKLKGVVDFQAGYFNSNAPTGFLDENGLRPNRISRYQKDFAFLNTASLGLEAINTLEDGFIYGAKLGIETTAKSSRKFQSCLFVQGDYGRGEMGSDQSAASKMRITPYSIASGAGATWDIWVKADPTATKTSEVPFVTGFSNFLDQKMRSSGKIEYSRKVTYYTPEIYGLQAGVSFIPDSSNVGYTDIKDTSVTHSPVYSKYYFYIKNGVSGGVTYKYDISKDLKMKLSLVGENGKVIAIAKNVKTTLPYDFGYLQTFNVGAQIDYLDWSFACAYADYLNSLTKHTELRKATNIFGGSIRYKINDASFSLAHIRSMHKNNKVHATTLGADYKIAPGLKTYAEATYFESKGAYLSEDFTKSTSHKGVIGLVGAKLEF